MKRPDPKQSMKDFQSTTAMRWPGLSYAVLPLVIIAVSILVSVVGYGLMNVNLEGSREKYVSNRLRENQLRLKGVFDSHAHLLWGSTGFLESTNVDVGSWQQFISSFDLAKNFAGLETVGVTEGATIETQPVLDVSPLTDNTRRVLGVDLGKQAVLQPTMRAAARTAEATLSRPIPNLFSTKESVTNTDTGFLMFAPYYDRSLPQTTEDERLEALRGFTVAMFRGDIFFQKAYGSLDLSHTKIDIYLGDSAPENYLYGAGTTTDRSVETASQQISFYGKKFTFIFTFDTAYMLSWSLTYMPQIILIGTLCLGMIFAGIAGYLLRSRYQRLTFEKERDVNFAKDELLSLASHQLRTPATGVKQYLGMVLQGFAGDVPDKQRAYLERAYASNNRQLHVINDILHMAKLETGRIVLSERQFDIAKMIRDVVEEQQDQATAGEITLHMRVPSQGLIVGDSHMLRMVVENLVSNAIKYTPPGGVVSVRLIRRGSRWVLTVKDTGVGIAKSDFSKLFKQFSRIANARSDFVTGTGVGLYLAHHLTILHGGQISVVSSKGKGSTFTVRLPRKM